MIIPRTHAGLVTSCSSCRENTRVNVCMCVCMRMHTHTTLKYTTKRISGSQAHANTHIACSAQPKYREVPRTLLSSLSSPCSCSYPPHLPPHTFRSTSLVPLEQVMTTQGGSAAMVTPSATSSCQPWPSVLWWGPDRNSFSLSTRPYH